MNPMPIATRVSRFVVLLAFVASSSAGRPASAGTTTYPYFDPNPPFETVSNWDATAGIAAGDAVILASGATYTSSNNPITNNGQLQFAVSGNTNFNNLYEFNLGMTGTGNVRVNAGWVYFTGANAYTGGTVIDQASLYGTPTSLKGNFVNQGTLGIYGDVSGTFTGNVSGDGSFYKYGTGTVTMAGSYTPSQFSTLYVEQGVLRGTTANLRGEIRMNGGTVTFNQTTSGTFDGRFFDPGQQASLGNVVKTGAADMTWTANNKSSFVGNTLQIQQGRLIGPAQSMDINGTTTISSGAEMRIDEPVGAFVYAMSTTIEGDGNVVKTGPGTVDMTQVQNDYSGDTTIAQGKIQYAVGSLPQSATTGSFGRITMSGSGSANSAGIDIYTPGQVGVESEYSGVMSGAGSVTVIGNSALLLTGNNTYTGGTYVESGRVVGTTQTMPGPITLLGDGAEICDVEYRQNTNATVSYAISGTGVLYKTGTGSLTLTGSSNLAGAVYARGGRLVVNNSMPNIARTVVEQGATLMGSGTLGSNQQFFIGLEVLDGVLSPGNSPGVLTTNDLDLSGDSTTIWELVTNTAAAGARGTSFDGINLSNGNLTIDQGADLNLVFNAVGSSVNWFNGLWDANQSWVLIDNVVQPTIQEAGVFTTINVSLDAVGGDLATLRPGAAFTTSLSNGDIVINYAAAALVPEPSSVALAITGLVGAAWFLGRRRRPRDT
jgi:autotransporter-associated beta strand protein